VLPGDGIGPDVIVQAVRVLDAVAERFDVRVTVQTFPVGAAGVAAANEPLPQETRAAVLRSDAVLLGAVGDPALDNAPRELRPETGLLALRKLLNVYANLRPVAVHPALLGCSPLKPERLRGVDLLVVRELTGRLRRRPAGEHVRRCARGRGRRSPRLARAAPSRAARRWTRLVGAGAWVGSAPRGPRHRQSDRCHRHRRAAAASWPQARHRG